jgi:hypothetical protein
LAIIAVAAIAVVRRSRAAGRPRRPARRLRLCAPVRLRAAVAMVVGIASSTVIVTVAAALR